MAAGYQDLFMEQGTSFATEITLDDSYGTPYNLTYFTAKCQAKKSYYTNSVAINFTAAIIDPLNGTIQLSASAAQTANVSPGKLVYDVMITDTNTGAVTKVLEGQIFMSPSISK